MMLLFSTGLAWLGLAWTGLDWPKLLVDAETVAQWRWRQGSPTKLCAFYGIDIRTVRRTMAGDNVWRTGENLARTIYPE
jgi:hypothetical protein